MDYTVHGIFQARILEWVAFPFSRGSSQLRDQTHISCPAGGFFTNWAVREALSWNRRLEISAHKSFSLSYYAVTSCFLFSTLLCFIFRELMFLCHWASIVWQAQAKSGRTPGIYILWVLWREAQVLYFDTGHQHWYFWKHGRPRRGLSWIKSSDFNTIVKLAEITLIISLSDSVKVKKITILGFMMDACFGGNEQYLSCSI